MKRIVLRLFTNTFARLALVSRKFPTMSVIKLQGIDLTDDRGPQVIKAIVACSCFSGVSFAGRIVSRKLLKANLLVSDYLVALGFLGAWLLSGLGIWGKHLPDLMPLRQKIWLRGLAHAVQTCTSGLENILKWFRWTISENS